MILGDNGPSPRFIETHSKTRHRFIAPGAGTASGVLRTRSIAVLPFDNLTGDPAQTYIADGIAEALTSSLGSLKGVRVISRISPKACVAAGKSLAAIGRDLHVNALVEGSVMRFAQFRVNARIVDVHSERVFWQGKYDCTPDNLLTSCDRLVKDIAAEIEGSPAQTRLSGLPEPAAPDVYLTYLKGRYLWNKRTEKDLYGSIVEFQRAIAIDPGFALAHTGLADAYTLVGIWGLEPAHSAFETARRASGRAIDVNDGLAEAHTCLAQVLLCYDWDWPGTETEFRCAIALNPNYSTAHHAYATLLMTLKRFPEAAEQIELARRVDPLSHAINAYVPYIYLAARDYHRAVAEGQRAVELEPYSPLAHWLFGRACLFFGDLSQALTELETASRLANRRPMWLSELCFARARAGDLTGAAALLSELIAQGQTSYVSPYDLALCHAGLGDNDAALNHLEHAYRERVMRIMAIGDPELDGLRGEPRFVFLVEQLRLPR